MNNVKFVQVGCGKMSIYTMRYAIENGYEIVGAVDINPEVIGKDVSTIIGGGELGVIVKHVDESQGETIGSEIIKQEGSEIVESEETEKDERTFFEITMTFLIAVFSNCRI